VAPNQDTVAARIQAEAAQARRAAVRRHHHLAVLRRRRRALRRQQDAQAADLGTTASPMVTYHGASSTQAQRAVAFAYAQLGCPYVYGGTGPCQSGYDCSGLTQAAWAAAGVTIQRTSEAQLASLPAVPVSQLRPGDLLVFDGGGHIGIYVGGGYLIDSPQPGETVEKVAFSGWYQQNFAGAVRP
jgi:cell wall-associated NlpC family hydrolase